MKCAGEKVGYEPTQQLLEIERERGRHLSLKATDIGEKSK